MQISNNARSDVVWFCHFLNFQLECTAHSWPNVPLHVINTNNAISFSIISSNVGKLGISGISKDQNRTRTADASDVFFSLQGEEGQARWASTHHTPRAMTTQQCPPHRRPGPAPPPITSGPKDPVRFLSPCSKCTSGSHLTPVRPNFHFRGRCGFQIIYHFPKCFHMCAAFPSAPGPCLRPTFSKCIKIQFAPKKFRHWCFIVVMSGNY